jgi:hypothetical protein
VRLLAIAALVTCAGCGAPERSRRIKPVKPGPTVEFPSGVFAITAARVVSDSCNGRLRFEARAIDVDMVAATVQTFPDNHAYEAVIDRQALVARGAFDKNTSCQTYRQLEIWRLDRHGDDEISGYRTTYWRDDRTARRGDCLEACKVVYAVEALRSTDGDEREEGGRVPSSCDPSDPLCGL